MSGNLIHQGALIFCSHFPGAATPDEVSTRVTLSGQALVTVGMQYTVSGCALNGTNSPPCTKASWTMGASRVTSENRPVAIDSGQSLCAPSFARLDPRFFQQRVTAS